MPPAGRASARFEGGGGKFRAAKILVNPLRCIFADVESDVRYDSRMAVCYVRSPAKLDTCTGRWYAVKMPEEADQMLSELRREPQKSNGVAKLRYTHQAMIDLIVQNPWISQNELAGHFGYSPSWISVVLASDAFQAALEQRRSEIVDPAIKATIEERFKALVILSLDVLHKKLSQPVVSDNVALRAAELGAKALGIGGNAVPPPAPPGDRLLVLAERLVVLQDNVRKGVTYEGERLSAVQQTVEIGSQEPQRAQPDGHDAAGVPGKVQAYG